MGTNTCVVLSVNLTVTLIDPAPSVAKPKRLRPTNGAGLTMVSESTRFAGIYNRLGPAELCNWKVFVPEEINPEVGNP